MRFFGLQFGLILVVSSFFLAGEAMAEKAVPTPAVIELFTSQGCSSCPPADRLLQELAKEQGVIVMSLPVTYWDYLGWKDTLAQPAFSERQRAYAQVRGDGQVYTPQAVVNGVKDCVGSNRQDIEAAIHDTQELLVKAGVAVSLVRRGDALVIEAGMASDGSPVRAGTVWLAAVQKSAPVAIGRGENEGRKLVYTNVVKKLVSAGRWQGGAQTYTVSAQQLGPEAGDTFIAFLQADNLGPIVGATQIIP